MKILVFTPLWKRPEIVREYVKSYNRLRNYADMDLLAVISPEDPCFDELMDILPPDTHFTEYKNTPFGEKKNAGAEIAELLKWDYLMELNSDSIVNPALLDLYRPYMDKKTPFFGLNNLYVVDHKTKDTVFLGEYNCGRSFGSGQMLHRDAFRCKLWDDNINEGLDTNKINNLMKVGVQETVVDCGTVPMIIDLKVDTTIWHFRFLEGRGEKVDYEIVKDVITCT